MSDDSGLSPIDDFAVKSGREALRAIRYEIYQVLRTARALEDKAKRLEDHLEGSPTLSDILDGWSEAQLISQQAETHFNSLSRRAASYLMMMNRVAEAVSADFQLTEEPVN